MTAKESCDIMGNAGIRPTSMRILVYEAVSGFENTFSLSDVEEALPDADKSSIFRAITVFSEHHLIHEVDDGTGSMKYCFCRNFGECTREEEHCHFYCVKCHKTYCLQDDAIPDINLPEGFVADEVSYVVKGVCPDCSGKA